MNPQEQAERRTAVSALDQRLTAVADGFDEVIEEIYRKRTADLMTISGLEALIADVDARLSGQLADWADSTNADINGVRLDLVMFRRMTFWQRMKWLLTGW